MSELNKPVGEPDEDPDLEFRTTLRFGNKAQVKKKNDYRIKYRTS